MIAVLARVVASRNTRLCARDLHADIPENVYQPPGGGRRRCRPCRVAYMRAYRRRIGPVVVHGHPRTGMLTDAQVAALRASLGCLGCGAVPVEHGGRVVTRHRAGCVVA